MRLYTLKNNSYDPLYRLLSATGREADTQAAQYRWQDAPTPATPNAQNSRAYTRHYTYDKFEHQYRVSAVPYNRTYHHIADEGARIASVRTGDATDDIPDSVVYAVEDHLSSVSLRLNASGGLIDREEYYPYGDSSMRT